MRGHLQHKPQHSQNSACINEETSTSMHDKIEQWHEEANMQINSLSHNTSKTAHTWTVTATTWGNSHTRRRQEPYHDKNDEGTQGGKNRTTTAMTRAHNDCIHWKDSRPRHFILRPRFHLIDVKPYHTRYFIRCYMYHYSNSFQNCVRWHECQRYEQYVCIVAIATKKPFH